MKTICIETPALYGDHHVTEVRRILLELPGVLEVYASSAFHSVEVSFDPEQISETMLYSSLDSAGYLGEMDLPVEMGVTAYHAEGGEPFFRHTATYETTRQVVSFAQNIPFRGRPLWPCPGMGPVGKREE